MKIDCSYGQKVYYDALNLVYFEPLQNENVSYLIYAIPVKDDVILIQIVLPYQNYPATQPALERFIKSIRIK